MESLTKASLRVCPFVKSHSTAAMKKLARNSSLVNEAAMCPIMGPAIEAKRSYTQASKSVSAQATDSIKATKLNHDATVKSNNNINLSSNEIATDYNGFFENELNKKRIDNSYRFFNNINRLAKEFPKAHLQNEEDKVMVWCSNDYLGMGKNQEVFNQMIKTMETYGVGAGGTRNIAGHNRHAINLESEIAALHV